LRLLGRVDTQETFWLALAPSERAKQEIHRLGPGLADRFEGLTFEAALRDKVLMALTVYAGDGETAGHWRKCLEDAAAQLKAMIATIMETHAKR